MSKITQALNKAQKHFSDAKTEQAAEEKEASLFLTEIDTEFKNPGLFEITLFHIAKYKWLIFSGSIIVCIFVFAFGVSQGIKIEQSFTEDVTKLNSSEPEAILPLPTFTVDDAGQPVILSSDQNGEYRIVSPEAEAEIDEESFFAPEGRYTLQLITYTQRSRAVEEMEKLEVEGYHAFILTTERHFQVCVQRFEKASDARNYLDKLSSDGALKRYPGAYIRVVKNL